MSDMQLPYLVEVKWPHVAYWETIAAFNCPRAAEAYRDRCFIEQKRSLGFEYRTRAIAEEALERD